MSQLGRNLFNLFLWIMAAIGLVMLYAAVTGT